MRKTRIVLFTMPVCVIFSAILSAEQVFLMVKQNGTQAFKGPTRIANLRAGQKLIKTAEKGNWIGMEWETPAGEVKLGWVRKNMVEITDTYEVIRDAGNIGLTEKPEDSLLGVQEREKAEKLLEGNLKFLIDWKTYDRDGSGELNLKELVELLRGKGLVEVGAGAKAPPPPDTK